MFENFMKINYKNDYAVCNKRDKPNFTIVQGGGKIIFDELRQSKSPINIKEFSKKLAMKYHAPEEYLLEDTMTLLSLLNGDRNTDQKTDNNTNIHHLDTYSMLYNSYTNENKIFKVFLELTYNCNLNCKHCYLGTDLNTELKHLTLEKAKEILDYLEKFEIVDLCLTGGELFTNPDAYEIIKYASEKNFLTTILTNGTLLTIDMIDKLVKLPLSQIRISLYGMKDFHNSFVGLSNAFDLSVQALKYMNKIEPGLGVAVSVITKDNFKELISLGSYLKEYNLEHRLSPIIYPTVKGDKSPTKLRITSKQYEELLVNGDIGVLGSNCAAGLSRIRISPSGNVNPCELFRNIIFGNIYELDLKEILDNREDRIKYIKNSLKNSKCTICNKRKYCPQCLGMFYLENGDPGEPSKFLCEWAKIKIEFLKEKHEISD